VFAQQTLTNYLGGALDTTSYAAFGRVTLAFTDTFRLSGGLRYTSDRKTVDGASRATGGGLRCGQLPGWPGAALTQTRPG
jgi:iron complex outermembrane receptor protein